MIWQLITAYFTEMLCKVSMITSVFFS